MPFALIAHAAPPDPAGGEYQMLEPLPEIGGTVTSYSQYFSGAYRTILIVIVLLAVIVIVVSGIQYSASFFNRDFRKSNAVPDDIAPQRTT